MGASSDGLLLAGSLVEVAVPHFLFPLRPGAVPGGGPSVPPSSRLLVSAVLASVELRSRRPVDSLVQLAPVEPCSRSLEAVVSAPVELRSSRPVALSSPLVPVEPCSRSRVHACCALVMLPPRRSAILLALLVPVEPSSSSLVLAVFASVEQCSRRPDAFPAHLVPVELCSRSLEALVFASAELRSRSPVAFLVQRVPVVAAAIAAVEQRSRRLVILLSLPEPVEPCSRSWAFSGFVLVAPPSRFSVALLDIPAPVEPCSRLPGTAVFASVEQCSRRPDDQLAPLGPVEHCSRPLELSGTASRKQRTHIPVDLPAVLAPVEPCSRSLEAVVISSAVLGPRCSAVSDIRWIVTVSCRWTAGSCRSPVRPVAEGAVPEFSALTWLCTVGTVVLRVARVSATLATFGTHALGQPPEMMGVLLHPKILSCISTVAYPLVRRPNLEGQLLSKATDQHLDPEALFSISSAMLIFHVLNSYVKAFWNYLWAFVVDEPLMVPGCSQSPGQPVDDFWFWLDGSPGADAPLSTHDPGASVS